MNHEQLDHAIVARFEQEVAESLDWVKEPLEHAGVIVIKPEEAVNWVLLRQYHDPVAGPFNWLDHDVIDSEGHAARRAFEWEFVEDLLLDHVRAGTVRVAQTVGVKGEHPFDALRVRRPELRIIPASPTAQFSWQQGLTLIVPNSADPSGDGTWYHDVLFFWEDVQRIRPVPPTPIETTLGDQVRRLTGSTRRPKTGTRTGPPEKWPISEFKDAAYGIALAEGLPEVKADMVRRMLEWCSIEWGNEPSERWVKDQVAGVYKTMGSNSPPRP